MQGVIVHYQCLDFQKMKKGVRSGFRISEERTSYILLCINFAISNSVQITLKTHNSWTRIKNQSWYGMLYQHSLMYQIHQLEITSSRPLIKRSVVNKTTSVKLKGRILASQPTTSNATKPTASCAAKGCETPRKKKLKRDVQKLKTKLWRKENKKKLTFKAEVDSFVLQLKNYLPQDTVNFIERQIILQCSAKTGRRYAISDKMLALSVFYQSQKAYKLLSKLFGLPSKRTLQKYHAEY